MTSSNCECRVRVCYYPILQGECSCSSHVSHGEHHGDGDGEGDEEAGGDGGSPPHIISLVNNKTGQCLSRHSIGEVSNPVTSHLSLVTSYQSLFTTH